jgi:hypothetical protein
MFNYYGLPYDPGNGKDHGNVDCSHDQKNGNQRKSKVAGEEGGHKKGKRKATKRGGNVPADQIKVT